MSTLGSIWSFIHFTVAMACAIYYMDHGFGFWGALARGLFWEVMLVLKYLPFVLG